MPCLARRALKARDLQFWKIERVKMPVVTILVFYLCPILRCAEKRLPKNMRLAGS